MIPKNPLQFEYDPAKDVMTIEGVRYGGDMFRGLAGLSEHDMLTIKRSGNGLLFSKVDLTPVSAVASGN